MVNWMSHGDLRDRAYSFLSFRLDLSVSVGAIPNKKAHDEISCAKFPRQKRRVRFALVLYRCIAVRMGELSICWIPFSAFRFSRYVVNRYCICMN